MDEVVGMYFGENWISLDPDVPYDETVDHINDIVLGYPGMFTDLLTYLRERIKEVLTGSSGSIVVRLYGEDLQDMRTKASEIRESIDGIKGVANLHVEVQEEIPQIVVKPDLVKCARIRPATR